VFEEAVEVSDEVALEAADDVAAGLAFVGASFGVGAGALVVAEPGQRDGV